MEKRGRKEKRWEESWNRAADWLRPALTDGVGCFDIIRRNLKICIMHKLAYNEVNEPQTVNAYINAGRPTGFRYR